MHCVKLDEIKGMPRHRGSDEFELSGGGGVPPLRKLLGNPCLITH
jgi:hypothetical protein